MHAILQPATDIVATATASAEDLRVAAATTQVSRPTRSAWFLPIDVSRPQEILPPVRIQTVVRVPQNVPGIINCAMACKVSSSCADRNIAGSGTAGQGLAIPGMQLL